MVLDKNRRSTTPILRTRLRGDQRESARIRHTTPRRSAYQRSPLQSAREEEAIAAGTQLPSPLVSAIILTSKDSEGPDLVSFIRDAQKKSRCKWSDFGILYRSHYHRDDVVRELAEAGIPFVIESMDISDTPEVRDLFACLNAVVSAGDDVSLFRVAGLPCFQVNPEQLRQVMRAISRDNREGQVVPLSSALDRVEGGADVLSAMQNVREEIQTQTGQESRRRSTSSSSQFALDATSPILQSALHFVADWEKKKINKTTDLEELVDYLGYFREAGGVIPLQSNETENAVRLMTVHGAKGLEFPHVFILRANSGSFPVVLQRDAGGFSARTAGPGLSDQADDKTLHNQEERRLFYVAMTRARDSLHDLCRRGQGKDRQDPSGLHSRTDLESQN